MCCPGCKAVAETIVAGGLSHYYKHRSSEAVLVPDFTGTALPDALKDELALYDNPKVQQAFVFSVSETIREATLVIEGITCAACVWLLEHHIIKQTGVEKVSVNLTNHRAKIRWNNNQTQLSQIMAAIYSIGYQGHPYHPDKEEQLLEQEKKRALRRLGVAGLGMMQVMMLAVALYAGALQGIESKYIHFIRWASLILATPVVLYCARPFFTAAMRDIKTRHLSMDVPVSLAIGGAYIASVWATLTRSGEIYFDSVTMFTFFLLIGRYLEMQARHRTGRAGNALLNLLPASATRITQGQQELIPANELVPGDTVLIKPGHTVPADGLIVQGSTTVDESALTGEYLPLHRKIGEKLIGGTLNVEHPVQITVTETGSATQLSAIVRLLERATEEKPAVAKTADAVASYFVGAVLITAVVVGAIWWLLAPENAFWITLSVLVVTCPCALSLATPTALTAATGTLRQEGLLITRGHVLESLARATHIVFDKTGTLTEGNLSLSQTQLLADLSTEQALEIAGALEAQSEHPIAKAFHKFTAHTAQEIKVSVGQGITGCLNGQTYRLGKAEFASQLCQQPITQQDAPDQQGQWLLLCSTTKPLAWFCLNDPLRKGAKETIQQLQQLGLQVAMLTGDSSGAVTSVADTLGISDITANATPQQKLDTIRTLQAQGAQVIMIGDGINDIPVLAGAQTSVAMGSATDLAKTNADSVLVSGDITHLTDALLLARKTRRVIRQNLTWALCYNLTALPLAAMGFVAPYMAAIGMSASSLVVVGNALRLTKLPRFRRVK